MKMEKRKGQHDGVNGIIHLISTIRYSLDGFKACYKSEVAFRQEIMFGVIHIVAIMVLPMCMGVRLYMVAVWLLLIAVELINSAVEAIVDLVSPMRNALAKKAKDYGSAAVCCVLLIIIGSWLVLLIDFVCAFIK